VGVRLADAEIRVLPETWVTRVSEFIRSSGTLAEAEAEERPETVFSRSYLPAHMSYYSDFNIRSRHFRCIETFFVAVGPDEEIQAVVSVNGLRTDTAVATAVLIVARPSEGDRAADLAALLDGVLQAIKRFAASAHRLRISYLYDISFEAAVGVRISQLLVDAPESLHLVEDARFPNETGRNREAVLLSFAGLEAAQAAACA
jgi:hypothetical protein